MKQKGSRNGLDGAYSFSKVPCQKSLRKTFGLTTPWNASSDVDLADFERRLDEIVQNVSFKDVKKSKVQKKWMKFFV